VIEDQTAKCDNKLKEKHQAPKRIENIEKENTVSL